MPDHVAIIGAFASDEEVLETYETLKMEFQGGASDTVMIAIPAETTGESRERLREVLGRFADTAAGMKKER